MPSTVILNSAATFLTRAPAEHEGRLIQEARSCLTASTAAFAAASSYAPSISGFDEHRMVEFSERAIDNDGFPALDDFTLLVRSKKN